MKLTGSKLPLLAKCKYAFREDVEWQPWPSSPEAQFGRALHRIAEWYVNGKPPDVVEAAREFDIEDDVPRLAAVWLHMLTWLEQHDGMRGAEIKLALHVKHQTGRRLDDPGERNYVSALDDEIPMTLDLVMFANRGQLYVYDWKTGHSADGYWPQLAVAALAVAFWKKAETVTAGILHATEDGVDDSRVRTFDRLDLAALCDDIMADQAAIEGSAPSPGPHCREMRCGAFATCPAILASVDEIRDLVPADKLVRKNALVLPILEANQGARYLEKARTAIALGELVKKAVEKFVGDDEWEVDDGVLKRTFRNVTRIDVSRLMTLAREKGATSDEIAACAYTHKESAGLRIVKNRKSA